MKKIIIIGASGHGKVVADIAEKCGYDNISFLDDNLSNKECFGKKVLGTIETYTEYRDHDFIVAIGNAEVREKIQNQLESDNMSIATLIHPNATVSKRVEIGKGTVIMAGAVINGDTKIGKGCIINTCASVDHDNLIGDYVHISVGSHTAGTVEIGKHTWLGIGAVISNNINVCDDCMIGAGAVIIKNTEESGTYVGVPARKVK